MRTAKARVTELAEDLAQRVVHFFQDPGMLVQGLVVQPGQPRDGLVNTGVTSTLTSK